MNTANFPERSDSIFDGLKWYLRVHIKEGNEIRAEFCFKDLTEEQVDIYIKELKTKIPLSSFTQSILDMIEIVYDNLYHFDDDEDFYVEYIKGAY